MTFPILVRPVDGQFVATLVGAPDVHATGTTRAESLAALEATIQQRLIQGDLVALEVGRRGPVGLAGKYCDDPTLRDICEGAYKERDSQRPE